MGVLYELNSTLKSKCFLRLIQVQAFQTFDTTDKGVISKDKLNQIMESLGQPIPKHEMREVLSEIEVDVEGNFDYVVLAKQLVSGPKGLPVNQYNISISFFFVIFLVQIP